MNKLSFFFFVFLSLCTQGLLGSINLDLSYDRYFRMNTPAFKNAPDDSFGLDLKFGHISGETDSHGEFGAKYYFNNGAKQISVPELYLRVKNEKRQWWLGRKPLNWSPHEKFWTLGELDPLRGFNLLDEKQEGLLGLYFSYKWKSFEGALFVSGLFVPQLNPSFSIENGSVSGANEWTNPPPEFVRFNNQNIPVHYTLDEPSISDIIFQESLGTKLKYFWDSGNFTGYGIYKPENIIRINATGYYEQDVVEQASVRAKPFVNHHLMYGVSVSQEAGPLNLMASWDTTDPDIGGDDTFVFEAFKIEPEYSTNSYFSASASWDQGNYFGLSANFIELLRGDTSNTNVFAKKPKWDRAVGLSLWWKPKGKFLFNGSYRHDLLLNDILVHLTSSYQLSRYLRFGLTADFLRAPKKKSFWSPYRANDTITGTLALTF